MANDDKQRTPQEAKRLMDETLRRMLARPPEPHVKPKAKPRHPKKPVK